MDKKSALMAVAIGRKGTERGTVKWPTSVPGLPSCYWGMNSIR